MQRPAVAESIKSRIPEKRNLFSVQQQLHGEAFVETAQYGTHWQENPRLNQSQFIGFHGDWQLKGEQWTSNADVFAGSFVDWGVAQFAVNELATSRRLGSNTSLAVGRKFQNWSFLDQNWNLGLWEPKFSLDSLRPTRQGLTGFFLDSQAGPSHYLFYFTPIFVPTMGPEIKEKNRGLEAESRWYRSPASTVNLFNRDVRIYYSLGDVNIGQLVNNWGMGASWTYAMSPEMDLRAAIGFKPINQLSIRYRRDLITNVPSPDGAAVVGPAVSYHSLQSLDFRWTKNRQSLLLSYLADQPRSSLPQRDTASLSRIEWIQQQPGAVTGYGLTYAYDFSENTRFKFEHLRIYEELTRDLDASGITRGSLFPHRMDFTNSLRATWSQNWTQSLLTKISWLRDEDQAGDVLQGLAEYRWTKSWMTHLGFDVLAVDDASPGNTDTRFLNQFRMNDRLYAGCEYAF